MWLQCTQGLVWPTKLTHLLDYSSERFDEGCGNTVLDSFQASLSVLELTGRCQSQKGFQRIPLGWLYTPKLESGKFRPNTSRLLLVENSAAFFAGHSCRNWMPSVAAALGYLSDEKDFLGRWLIGGAGSAEYTRTARQVVRSVQIAACSAITCGLGGIYDEEESLLAWKEYVDQRGGSGALARRRHDILITSGGVKSLGLKWPVFQAPLATTPADDEDECPEVVPSRGGSQQSHYISVSSASAARQVTGGCTSTALAM